MKKILVLFAIIFAMGLYASDQYVVVTTTIGDIETVVTSDTLEYADTNEHGFNLNANWTTNDNYDIYYYSAYVVEIQVIYRGNPNNVNLTIGVASSGQNLTVANAITQFDSDYWLTEVIDLNTSGGTGTECFLIPEALLNGKYIYFKYQYSGDPGNDPKIAIFVTRI